MISAALAAAALDRRRLEHLTFRVYVVLHAHLDTGLPRPLKRLVIAEQVGLQKAQVSRALRQLVESGYLERGPDTGDPGRQQRTYRLTVSPTPLQLHPKGLSERERYRLRYAAQRRGSDGSSDKPSARNPLPLRAS